MSGTIKKRPEPESGQGHNPPYIKGVLSRPSRWGASKADKIAAAKPPTDETEPPNEKHKPSSNDSAARIHAPADLLGSQPERSEPSSQEKAHRILAAPRDSGSWQEVCRSPRGDRTQNQERERGQEKAGRDLARVAGSEAVDAENLEMIEAANGFWGVKIRYGATPGKGAGAITLDLGTNVETEARELAEVAATAFRKAEEAARTE